MMTSYAFHKDGRIHIKSVIPRNIAGMEVPKKTNLLLKFQSIDRGTEIGVMLVS